MIAAPETSTLAAEAYTIVRRRILRGELSLGQAVSRRRVAAELGMSFLPVSEALLRLELEGLVESRPRAGTRVRIPSPDDVTGHYVVREALEVQAATLFAARATAGERAELAKLAARVDALSLQPDRTFYLALHQALHQRIAECARCAPLCDAVEKAHALTTIWSRVTRQPVADASSAQHQRLVEALASGDAATATAAMRAHIAAAMTRTLEALEPYFRLREASGKTFFRTGRPVARPLVPPAIN